MFEFIFHLIKLFLCVVIGAIYLPLNLLFLKVSAMYQGKRQTNPVDYWLVRILIFPLWLVVTVLSVPYEMMLESAH
jgi:hypothetical protein